MVLQNICKLKLMQQAFASNEHVTRFDQRTDLVYCLQRNKLNLSKMKKTTYVSVPLGPKVWNQNKGSNKGNWCMLTNEKGGKSKTFICQRNA